MIDIISFFLVILSLPGACYLLLITVTAFIALHPPLSAKNSPKYVNKALDICVVIPAHNEESGLADSLVQLKNCIPNHGSAQIWVVADNCTDKTEEIAQQHNCNVLIRNNLEKRGKSYALEYAFEYLLDKNFDLFVVIDADSFCEANLLIELEAAFANGADAVQLINVIKADNNPYSILTSLGFIAMNFLRPVARKKLGISSGIFGTGFALSAKVLKQCPYTTHSLVEDAQYHLKLIKQGYKSELIETSRVYSGVPKYDEGAQAQRNRWEGGRLRLLKDNFVPLLRRIVNGDRHLIDALAEILLMPLSYHLMTCLILVTLSINSQFLLIYSLFNIGVISGYFLLAIKHSDTDKSILEILRMVPGYMLWKIKILSGSVTKSQHSSSWVRTRRK